MRRISIAVAALLLCGGAALAADDPMAGFYGNTVISTGNGIESRTHFNADHTFDAKFTQGAQIFASKGTWTAAGGQVCRTYDPPPPGFTNPICIPAEPHKVGDHWTVTAGGGTRDVTLVAGVQ
jgi:hypothetical protein